MSPRAVQDCFVAFVWILLYHTFLLLGVLDPVACNGTAAVIGILPLGVSGFKTHLASFCIYIIAIKLKLEEGPPFGELLSSIAANC